MVAYSRGLARAALALLCLELCALASSAQPASYPYSIVGEVVGVTDGDTIKVLRGGKVFKIRLNGIDAPELGQAFGKKSKEFLSTLVFRREVDVVVRDMDRYGRYIGDVMIDGRSANAELVAAGLAWRYRAYSKDPALAALEEEARAKRLGLWADPAPLPPWEFRHKRKQ